MADFRRWILALAVIALLAGAASAQVGVSAAGASANSALACVATAAGTPLLRPEGYTELLGDVVINCTGGPTPIVGSQIPTVNIVVQIQGAAAITSRYLSGNGGTTEALLLIDEPGSGLPSSASGPYGPKAAQIGCQYSTTATVNGQNPNCPAYVGLDTGVGGPAVAVNGIGSTVSAANVFQGKLKDNGENSVTFYSVPVLPPATAGLSRVFRITNIRVPAINAQSFSVLLSASPSTVLPISQTTITVGVVGPAMSAAVNSKPKINGSTIAGFLQCNKVGSPSLAATISYTEGFATGFKTRVVPGGSANGTNSVVNASYLAEQTNTGTGIGTSYAQNIPGGLYGGFAQNSESGFIFSASGFNTANTGSTAVNQTTGLADFGTRLEAIFYNVPSGLTLYVSTTSGTTTTSGTPGGTSALPFAVLVNTSAGGDDNPDSSAGNGGTAFAPVTSSTAGNDGLFATVISPNSSGTAYAEWEVVNSDPVTIDTLVFSVYIAYTPSAVSSSNPYGLPVIGNGLPPGAPTPTIQMLMSPYPNSTDFSVTDGSSFGTSPQPVPRFSGAVEGNQSGWLTISLCQTTLLYPYVSTLPGLDTGIAVANTTMDPFNGGTVAQTGSCTLYPYGVTQGATGTVAYAGGPIYGCDAGAAHVATPLPGVNCFGGPLGTNYISAGQVGTIDLLGSTATPGPLPNFNGYIFAICNFQYAHGYAAVTDQGIHYIFSSYLALEVNSNAGTQRPGALAGVENLIH